jgi:hypothetical protein
MSELVFELKESFELIRNGLSPEDHIFVNEEMSKMESFGFEVWASYICNETVLKNNIDAFLNFCQHHVFAGFH